MDEEVEGGVGDPPACPQTEAVFGLLGMAPYTQLRGVSFVYHLEIIWVLVIEKPTRRLM